MVNKSLFKTTRGKTPPPADTVNAAGGLAYKMEDEQALVQYAVTGCFNNTFYSKAEEQLATVLDLAKKVDPKFLAQVAIYSREYGYMKDMPSVLMAVLATKDVALLRKVFPIVANNGLMVKS